MQSSSGDTWLATDGEGLIRVGPDGKEAHAYTVDDNLVSNSINSLLEDNEGRIWFSTAVSYTHLPESSASANTTLPLYSVPSR